MFFFYLALTILGLVIGSFLGMLAYRLPRRISITGRSFCPKCKKKISWYQNVPIVYYLISAGKCGECGKKIHWRYPAIELATAVSFVTSGWLWLNLPTGLAMNVAETLGILSLPFFLLLVTCYLLLTIIDLEFQILPDEILLVLGSVVLIALLFSPSPTLFQHIFWGFISFVFFLVLYLVTKGRGMGFGDVKMSAILGSLVGFPGVLVWGFVSFLTGAVVGIILLVTGRASIGKPIPFGPFLLASNWLVLFYGEKIVKWYSGLL